MAKTIRAVALRRASMLVAALAGLFAGSAEAAPCGSNVGRGLEVVGLTSDQRLVCFREYEPGGATTIGTLAGFSGKDTSLVGIDFRPATGELYGLGDAGGLYTIDLLSAQASFEAQLSVPLSGTSFGVDFNPTVDRLRIVGDDGQNLRANVTDGAVTVDAPLNYPAPAGGVTGVGYTNNDADSNTATTLYDIDSVLDQVAIQAPPNSGSLNPTGKLQVDAGSEVGFDVYSRLLSGTTVELRGLASLFVGGVSRLYQVNLFTGRTTLRGSFGGPDQVVDIAIPLAQN